MYGKKHSGKNDLNGARLPPEVTGVLNIYEEPAILLGHDYRILAANPAYRSVYGGDRPLERRYCYEVSHHYKVPCDQAGENCPLKASLSSGKPHRVLHLHHTSRGEEHVDVEIHPIRGASGSVAYFIEVMRHSKVASATPSQGGLVGRSPAFMRMLELIQRVAPSDAAVLLQGESGTGKELAARAIHDASRRADGPFVPVECSGLTESLFESELFGHEKGAFTGAHYRKTGLVEAARGGTLFLDEIGDVPLSLQVKLLRLLETRTYRRVGSIEPQHADFRLVCATHRDLRKMVEEGHFREDLYYRISAFPIHLPALRERLEDLPVLAKTLLARIAEGRPLRIHPTTSSCLRNYRFPGNIRELRNILERASLLTDGDTILPEHLPESCQPSPIEAPTQTPATEEDVLPLDEMERRYLLQAAARFKGDKRALAEKLGISERTLYRKLQSLKD